MRRWFLLPLVALAAATFLPRAARAGRGTGEIELSSDEFKQLDTFEAHSLSKADKAFGSKGWRAALAAYEAFLREFDRSRVLPYVVLRKGRCLHHDDKRFDAVKQYREVLDYWPNRVKYAAAALFYLGQCHWENGDEDQAMKVWADMADDADYSKHPLAADAINQLADYMVRKDQARQAVEYYEQVAVDFRKSNSDAARRAIDKAVYHHVRREPDEARLRAFYRKVGTFQWAPRKVPENLDTDRDYWNAVRNHVKKHGRFEASQTELKQRYYATWAEAMDGRFADWDDYQIDLANFHLAATGDVEVWMKRLDAQFEGHKKPGQWDRLIRWIAVYHAHKSKVNQYYNQLDFTRMKNWEIESLVKVLFEQVKAPEMAKNAFFKLRLAEMTDDHKAELARYMYERDADIVKSLCRSMKDEQRGQMEFLRYYYATRQDEEGLKLADAMVSVPQYAGEARQIKAELHERLKQWSEALAAWQQINQPPETSWRIADCHYRLGSLGKAVAELRQVETFFPDHAAEACLKVAYLYNRAGEKDKTISTFKEVLKKYPQSRQSSTAHHELEKRGITRIRGGEDAE